MSHRPHCVTLVGLPAVGKSTLAKDYVAKGYTLLSGDAAIEAARQKYGLATFDEAYALHRVEISQSLDHQLKEAIKRGDNIVSDALNVSRRRRDRHMQAVRDAELPYRCEAIVIHPPEPEEYARRLEARMQQNRLGSVDKQFHDKLSSEFEMPSEKEGYEAITEIGVRPLAPAIQR